MKIKHEARFTIAVLVIGLACGFAMVADAKTTDMSDLWWIPNESGWGIQFVEEETTIFATMFVYGNDNRPTWYTATLSHVAFGTWSGKLYATSGPWFGNAAFDSSQVTVNPVGTMTLSAALIDEATLTYDVNGVHVVKAIQRQTLVNLDFNGTYVGMLSQQGAGLPCSPARNTSGTPATFQITQNGPVINVVATGSADTCTLAGAYAQAGHFGSVHGTYSCASGDSGTFALFEMAVSWYDFRARTALVSQNGCTLKGYVNGLLQPPPAQ